MTYLLLLVDDAQVEPLVAGTGGAVVAAGESAYAVALGALRRCTREELRWLEMEDLRRLKQFVAGVASPPPAPGPVGSKVAVVRDGDRTEV